MRISSREIRDSHWDSHLFRHLAYVYKDYQIDAGNPRSVFHSAGFGRPALDLHSQVQKELLDTFIDAVINET